MKNNSILHGAACCLLGAFVGTSCNDDLASDSHYKSPSFLKGNAYETLQKDGNYSIFLKGVDLSGYKDIVDGKSILTVVAPTDDAFRTFLQEKRYDSIEAMYEADPTYVTKLITYHLLYYAYDWEKMVNFRPIEGDGATDADKMRAAGEYYRFRTKCSDGETTEFNKDPLVNADVQVVHYERLLPVFSSALFKTLGIDAKTNYEYFFPGTEWKGDTYDASHSGGFNICNAAVLDADNVITDNGYLYHVDHVIEPLNTIYDELRTRSDYSIFSALYDEYSSYSVDETESTKRGYTVYDHLHSGVPNIAMEWPTLSYLSMQLLCRNSYNLFVPSDSAFKEMFFQYWEPGCGYTDVSNLNSLIQYYFIMQSFSDEYFMCFPEQITKGEVLTMFGTPITIDPYKVSDLILCNNGTIFGMDKMEMPIIFSSVAGPAFKNIKYLPWLYTLRMSGDMLTLAAQNASFIALVPDTAQFTAEHMQLYHGSEGDVLQTWSDEEGTYTNVGSSWCKNVLSMHLSTDAEALNMEGQQVIETNASFNYWYVYNGKITTNGLFNQLLNPAYTEDPFVPFTEMKRTADGGDWNNGRVYTYDYAGIFAPADAGQTLESRLALCNDKNYPYYVFSQLLSKAGLASNGLFAAGLQLDPNSPRFIAFVPTNEALAAALNELPGCSSLKINADFELSGSVSNANKILLSSYLLSYFITADRNTFTAYPFLGSSTVGKYDTGGSNGIEIFDNGTALSVGFYDKTGGASVGDVIPVKDQYHYFPFAFTDGCFHLLDGVLK